MDRKLIEDGDKPLLKVGNEFDRFNYVLKIRDRETVPLVMEYLHNAGMDVYLGGKVVSNWIFNRGAKYSDVDILGVSRSEETRLELVQRLGQLSTDRWLPEQFRRKDLPKEISALFKMIGELEIKARKFRVARVTPGLIDESFKFFPAGNYFKPSIIDVCLVSKERFQ